jgi:hypothetical protein
MYIKSGKHFTTSRTRRALIGDILEFSGTGIDGVVPTISLGIISEVTPNLLVCFVTERTASERFFHRMVHGGLVVL